MNRKTPPLSKPIDTIAIQQVEKTILGNGIPVYHLNAGVQEVVKVELVFPNSMFNPNEPILASSVNRMLGEGTSKHNAQQLADMFDYYGAFYETSQSADYCSVEINTLSKYLGETLPILFEVLTDAVFPQNELSVFKQNNKQRLIVENEKVNSIARKKFGEIIFGSTHPYGYYSKPEDYENLNRERMKSFHKSHYTGSHCTVLVSGSVSDKTLKLVDTVFGNHAWKGESQVDEAAVKSIPSVEKKHYVERGGAVQSAIRIGFPLFNRTHPDYHGMLVLNTILGGYFGSRLMKNIREDKGYTYGIGSAVVSMLHGGYFFISSEVGADVCSAAISEIYKEISILKKEPVDKDELQMVKNYLLGSFLKGIDGAFNLADRWKSLLYYDLDYDYYYRYIDTIRAITSEQLMELAQKYFNEDSFYELVVGKK